MKEILGKDPILVNAKDNKKLTPLHHAIAYKLYQRST
jgi:hypothetical protein